MKVNYATAERAAEERGVSPRRMRQLLQQGRIQGAVRIGRQWCIPLPGVVLPPEAKAHTTKMATLEVSYESVV